MWQLEKVPEADRSHFSDEGTYFTRFMLPGKEKERHLKNKGIKCMVKSLPEPTVFIWHDFKTLITIETNTFPLFLPS